MPVPKNSPKTHQKLPQKAPKTHQNTPISRHFCTKNQDPGKTTQKDTKSHPKTRKNHQKTPKTTRNHGVSGVLRMDTDPSAAGSNPGVVFGAFGEKNAFTLPAVGKEEGAVGPSKGCLTPFRCSVPEASYRFGYPHVHTLPFHRSTGNQKLATGLIPSPCCRVR